MIIKLAEKHSNVFINVKLFLNFCCSLAVITPFIVCRSKVLQIIMPACVHGLLTKSLYFYIIFPKLFSKEFPELIFMLIVFM